MKGVKLTATVVKVKKEVPTVIEVNGRKYALVHETNHQGKVRK